MFDFWWFWLAKGFRATAGCKFRAPLSTQTSALAVLLPSFLRQFLSVKLHMWRKVSNIEPQLLRIGHQMCGTSVGKNPSSMPLCLNADADRSCLCHVVRRSDQAHFVKAYFWLCGGVTMVGGSTPKIWLQDHHPDPCRVNRVNSLVRLKIYQLTRLMEY